MKLFSISIFAGILATSILGLAIPITMLQRPEDSMQARVDYINRAQKSITAQFFTIDHDRISMGSLALLRNAAARGVKVKILVDSLNNKMSRDMMAALMMNTRDDLKGQIEIREYNSFHLFHPSRLYKRMHDKSLIIDEEILIIGGRNVANSYYELPVSDSKTKNFRDADMIVFGGKPTQDASNYFKSLWESNNVSLPTLYEFERAKLSYDACMGNENTFDCQSRREINVAKVNAAEEKFNEIVNRVLEGRSELVKYDSKTDWMTRSHDAQSAEFLFDPVDGKNADKVGEGIAKKLYDYIENESQKNVLIITPYFILTPEQEQLFKKLIDRGVDVTVITNSRKTNDVPAAQAGYEMTRNRTTRLGVKIFEFQGEVTLHEKLVLVDQNYLFIGSYNWDYRSQNLNREVGVMAKISLAKENSAFKSDLNENILGVLSESKLYEMNSENNEKLMLKDIFSLGMRDRHILMWKILFPIIKKQL